MINYLIQKKWFRELFSNKTYYRSNGIWRDLKFFKKGQMINDIDGKWNTKAYCKCGNELVHSNSFIKERYVTHTDQYVYDYKCSFCGNGLHYNPDIIPGLLKCNKDGSINFDRESPAVFDDKARESDYYNDTMNEQKL
jgi:hypothetical protein